MRRRAGGPAWPRGASVSALTLAAMIVVWEALGRSGWVREVFLPPFSVVIGHGLHMARAGELSQPIAESLLRALGGLALAAATGVPAGVAMARVRWVRWAFDLPISVGFPMPKIAFIPICILWFGIGHWSKIAMVAFTCVFPLTVSAYHGALGVPSSTIWSARSLGTSPQRILWRIVIPAALPAMFSGLRVALPLSFLVVFTTEMVAGGGGLGFLLVYAQRFMETPTVYVALLCMLAIGYGFDRVFLGLRRRVLRWHEEAA